MQAIFRRARHVDQYCTPFPTRRDSRPESEDSLYLNFNLVWTKGRRLLRTPRGAPRTGSGRVSPLNGGKIHSWPPNGLRAHGEARTSGEGYVAPFSRSSGNFPTQSFNFGSSLMSTDRRGRREAVLVFCPLLCGGERRTSY
jgi:hypothetical protein